MTEIISGLHSCKAENTPREGDIKNFLIENKTSKNGKPYLKIKSATVEYGGRPYKIVSAKPTGFTDPHGNVSFNLEVTQENGAQSYPAVNLPSNPPQLRASTASGPHSTATVYEDRSSRIERQHSQEMAIRYFALTETAVPTTTQLREMTSWFQRDIGNPSTPLRDDPPVPEEQEEIDF